VPGEVRVTESFAREPVSEYGRNKKACEDLFFEADARGDFRVTTIRPSSTYGEGSPLIDQLEFQPVAWDRIARGLPVLCAGDGLGLWNSTHRDDVGKLFAHASLNRKTFGTTYNATTQRVMTWRDYYREAATALGTEAKLVFMPADWIVGHDRKRFGLLDEITRYHGAYDSSRAMRDVPEYTIEVTFVDGAKRMFEDLRSRNAWKDSTQDTLYESMVQRAMSLGVEPVSA
jgi:nucleoside-diphosphate-sugar epimerase